MKVALALASLAACRHPAPVQHDFADNPYIVASLPDASVVDSAAENMVMVEVEVSARIVDAKPDKAAGVTIVTIAAGSNAGVEMNWLGTVVDDNDAVLGTVVITEVKPRTTIATSPLSPDKLEGKRVRLVSPR